MLKIKMIVINEHSGKLKKNSTRKCQTAPTVWIFSNTEN